MSHFTRMIGLLALCLGAASAVLAQTGSQEPTEKEKTEKKPELPFQIQLLETRIRFAANGDSRKEVHTIVKIINVLGAHQFSRIAFDYNRSFQQVEIPLVRISHANGGTSEVLPSAVTDTVNPTVEPFPAYHDVRVKAVRILGLQEGDTLEYRVITTTTKHPLTPDFWLEHTFDRSGQVLHEMYELDLPASRAVRMIVSPSTLPTKMEIEENGVKYTRHSWKRSFLASDSEGPADEKSERVVGTSFQSWRELAERLAERLIPTEDTVRTLAPKAKEIVGNKSTPDEWIRSFYDFVSQKIKTIDVPLGTTGFRTRTPADVLSTGYATPEDKFVLFAALSNNFCGPARAGLVSTTKSGVEDDLPKPDVFDHLLTISGYPSINLWMDLNLEVAPFEMIPAQIQRKRALLVAPAVSEPWHEVVQTLPFRAFQHVSVDAAISSGGELKAKVKYTMRGDNELVLRMAFHQAPKEKWKDVANLLAISDGFRGQIVNVNASDPLETKDPFTVEYELTQPKFVDWTKKPVRVPALLPQIGMPDLPAAPAAGQSRPSIELGTPLEVQTTMTLRLPAGTGVETPPGTSVSRDYATFASRYSSTQNTATAWRHIHFLKREISGDRGIDYNAFYRAVLNDESQRFTLAAPSADSH